MLLGKVGVSGTSSYRTHEDGNKFYARKLAQIMVTLGFDGYLMNFECDLTEKETDTLLMWLDILRRELHGAKEGSMLVWYDSILTTGHLKWQSALTEHNYPFF
jgi:mannosyl-glycoprotein endo-beta-N-acetylglucosaminidase